MTKAGGVGIYGKNPIICPIKQDLNFKWIIYEFLWLELSIVINNKNNNDILVGLIYCHPGTSILDFSRQFSQFLLENIAGFKNICIFRDININCLNDKVTSLW